MYLQITERCNMKCKHCCYSCTSKGLDMSLKIFEASLENLNDGYITLGGGEPTLHPLFLDFLIRAIAHKNTEETGVTVITNGKIKQHAVTLSNLAKKGVIGAELSIDSWHEKIDESVIKAFTRPDRKSLIEDKDFRGIRTVNRIMKMGRARKKYFEYRYYVEVVDGCACEELFIDPLGTVFGCGCKVKDFGTVFDPRIPEDYQNGEYCGMKEKENE